MHCDEITHTNIENGPLMGGPELFEHKAIIGLKDYVWFFALPVQNPSSGGGDLLSNLWCLKQKLIFKLASLKYNGSCWLV